MALNALIRKACCLALTAGLIACDETDFGGKKIAGWPEPSPAASGPTYSQDLTLDEFVDGLISPPPCPLKLPGEEHQDIGLAGIRLGSGRDEVLAALRCERRGYAIDTFDEFFDFEVGDVQLDAQYIILSQIAGNDCSGTKRSGSTPCPSQRSMKRPATASISDTMELWTPGFPGSEVLLGVWRGQTFHGLLPPVKEIVDQLTTQFGAPSHSIRSVTSLRLEWGRDNEGTPLSLESPQFTCILNLDPANSHNSRWREPCGFTAAATIALSADKASVDRYRVAMFDQHALAEMSDAMKVRLEERGAPR